MKSETRSMPTGAEEVRELVRKRYGEVASQPRTSCCGPGPAEKAQAERIGYEAEDLERAPDGANLGLGCGNPTAVAGLRPGEVVVDLGAGAGLDAFIAADRVGPEGRVIGVDMTPEMLAKARAHAVAAGVEGFVEFREGIIEELPVASESADVVISNCVINLSPDKPRAFREAFRVLKPGGRLAVSDILLSAPLPEELARSAEAYTGCVGGALPADEYLAAIEAAGFVDIEWTRRPAGSLLDAACSGEQAGAEGAAELADAIGSYTIEARRP